METFDSLKSQWEKQALPKIPADGAKQIAQKIKTLKRNQWFTTTIISLTVVVLIGFFFYISAYLVPVVTVGLLLMIFPLVVRIVLEIFSIRAMERMDVSIDTTNFKDKIVGYYRNRIKVHFVATPLILALYITGFILLMPSFKAGLSPGFYTYIQVSSVIILIALGALIANTIKKELAVLKQLKAIQ